MATKNPGRCPGLVRGTRCLILNPVEADLLAEKDEGMLAYLRDLARIVGGWEGYDVEFCDPLGCVVLTIERPEGVVPWGLPW